jgi:hypothetical protein
VAEIETIVQPDCVADDVRWESMALVCIHEPILSISVSLLGDTLATGIHEEIYSQHPIYLSYTSSKSSIYKTNIKVYSGLGGSIHEKV